MAHGSCKYGYCKYGYCKYGYCKYGYCKYGYCKYGYCKYGYCKRLPRLDRAAARRSLYRDQAVCTATRNPRTSHDYMQTR
jgi:hypothetical protein